MKLGEIIEKPISGEWGDEDVDGVGVPVLRTTNFTNEGVLNWDSLVTRLVAPEKREKKYLRPGDVVIEKSGGSDKQPVGRVVFYDGPERRYLFNNFTAALRLKESLNFSAKFLFYALFAVYRRGGTKAYQNKTTGIRNLQLQRYLSELEIPAPPLATQERIVAELDAVAATLKKRQTQLAELEALVESHFVELFGALGTNPRNFATVALSDVCRVNPKKNAALFSNDDFLVSFVPMPAVSERGEIDASSVRPYRDVKKGFTFFEENDVLFAKITPCMENGKGAVARGLKNGVGFGSTEFHVLRPTAGVANPFWLYQITAFRMFRNDAEKKMTG
ncbi:MAG: restriction endonuclease subunit S, partial [Thermoguttaceae bacterium]|nr:restriction endonuclease subunit S [Thermoguttaceae bacterium]